MKLRKFSLYSKLYERLKLKTQRQQKLECCLDHSEVPGIRVKWSLDEKIYPYLDSNTLNKYCSFEHQGKNDNNRKPLECCRAKKLLRLKLYISYLECLLEL